MRVLIACECSGRVRDAFRHRGHDAWSCDLKPSETPGPHLQCDVRWVLDRHWDMLIGFPDCTYVCGSGIHWNGRRPGREAKTRAAIAFFQMLLSCGIPRIGLENPIGVLSTEVRRPDQIIQPYQFGEDASKATCLWLDGLPRLKPTKYFPPRIVNGRPRWGNQTDGGQNKLAPSETRAADRARTYQGIAEAMAEQWGIPSPTERQIRLFS